MDKLNVGILIFDNVEVLDFTGPFEVFSRTRTEPGPMSRRSDETAPFNVFTVAKTHDVVQAIGGLKVLPFFDFKDTPPIDLLVVPGGLGTRSLLEDDDTLSWIRDRAAAARHTVSVCTGSLVLAKIGLLAGRRATTHWGALDELASIDATIDVDRTSRYVDDGYVTSAGVSAGMDMAFYMVERLCGPEIADETARYIEYRRNRENTRVAV